MPNIEELMDAVGQTISEKKSGEIFSSTLDLMYAYGQLSLSRDKSVHCKFGLSVDAQPERIDSKPDFTA